MRLLLKCGKWKMETLRLDALLDVNNNNLMDFRRLSLLVLIVSIFITYSAGSSCTEHPFKTGKVICDVPVKCNKGTEPVPSGSHVTCKSCKPGYYMPTSHMSDEMEGCRKHRDCPGPEYKIHRKGTATNDTDCSCNEDEGYFPDGRNKRYGGVDEVKCFRMNITNITEIASGLNDTRHVEDTMSLNIIAAITVSTAVGFLIVLALGVILLCIVKRRRSKNSYNIPVPTTDCWEPPSSSSISSVA